MPDSPSPARRARRSVPRTIARILLGLVLVTAGTGHLTFARQAFQAQVPPWLPFDPDLVVVASGVVEIALGLALVLLARWQVVVGVVVAAFFVAVFPGNVSQLVTRTPAFGLETDAARAIRLLFQPLLVIAALWSTGAYSAWRSRRRP
ncbi:DoxX family membrane protein [Rathayibacter sp. ZW T2_19]|uniref:DoxX family membrane protein n=1 Tax=Rathayibacter rubneri TaxID=2950106 RepID=A0A9X2E1Q6_9MICO|nr:DoxX family membrane protein [Rathayibacter rubneri]MCM6764271.1 DoxX family membrane protein [Rathayibacter rubneri]